MMSVSAMIFAAGLGSRLYPLTKDRPKALVEIGGQTLLERAIVKITGAGIKKIVVNVHHFSEQIIDFVKDHSFDAEIIISDESQQLLDTAGGLKYASPLFQEELLLLYNVDIISSIDLRQLLAYHTRSGAMATLAVKERPTQRYFIFEKETMHLKGWTNLATGEEIILEKPENPILLAFSGIHVVNREFTRFIPDQVKQSLTPVYLEVAKKEVVQGYWHQNDEWMDIGKYDELVNKGII